MKVRHVDLYADEFLAGIVGMPLEEIAAYFVVCLLIYSSGGPIPIDDSRLHGFGGGRRCGLATLIKRVIARGKLDCKDTAQGVHISCKRAALELQRASKRTAQSVQNGSKGGRPKKEDQRVAKPDGSGGEKLTNQLTKEDSPSTAERLRDLLWNLSAPCRQRRRLQGVHQGAHQDRFRQADPGGNLLPGAMRKRRDRCEFHRASRDMAQCGTLAGRAGLAAAAASLHRGRAMTMRALDLFCGAGGASMGL